LDSVNQSELKELLAYLTPQEREQLDILLQPTATELTQRKTAAETSLHEFVKQAWHIVEPDTDFVDGHHVRLLCEHLEAVFADTFKNLLINVPPGCMKSLLTCVFFPCWVWAMKPEARWMFASFSDKLSTRDSQRRRDIFQSDWFRGNWGEQVAFASDENRKTSYRNKRGGWMYATSVGGGGLGEHPDFIIVDDPHKTKAAESETQRDDVLDWWTGTIASRGRTRGVRKIVIMQRLHEEDLSGHIVETGGYEHICLPMRYEPGRMDTTSIGGKDWRTKEGELLWPELFDAEKVDETEREMRARGPHVVAGQMQQRPVAREGGTFKVEWLSQFVDAPPLNCKKVRYWDKAGTQDGGDYTAGVHMVRDKHKIYVVDVVWGQWSIGARNSIMRQTAELDRLKYGHVSIWTEQEPGSGGKESAEITARELAEFGARYELSTGRKEDRAEPFAAACERGDVYLVRGPWNQAYIDELTVFPYGKHDDQVDASSGAYNKLMLSGNRVLSREIFDVTPEQELAYQKALRRGEIEELPTGLEGFRGHWSDDL